MTDIAGIVVVGNDRDRERVPMRQENLRQLVLGLILLITLSECDTSRQPTPSSLSDNGHFMAL